MQTCRTCKHSGTSHCACENCACIIFEQKEDGGKSDLLAGGFFSWLKKTHLGLKLAPERILVRGLWVSTEVNAFVRSEKAKNPQSTPDFQQRTTRSEKLWVRQERKKQETESTMTDRYASMEPIVIVRILLILQNIDIQVYKISMKLIMNNIVDKVKIMKSLSCNFAIHCKDFVTSMEAQIEMYTSNLTLV